MKWEVIFERSDEAGENNVQYRVVLLLTAKAHDTHSLESALSPEQRAEIEATITPALAHCVAIFASAAIRGRWQP